MYTLSTLIIFVLVFELSVPFPDFGDVDDMQIVYPRIYHTKNRKRRDIYGSISLEEEIDGGFVQIGDVSIDFHANVQNLMVRPDMRVEWISGDGTVTKKLPKLCRYISGIVRGGDETSKSAIVVCGNLISGYIDVGSIRHFIEPLNGSDDAHLFYTSRRLKRESPDVSFHANDENWLFNLTGDTPDFGNDLENAEDSDEESESNEGKLDTEIEEKNLTDETLREWRREQLDSEEAGYFYDTAWTADTSIVRRRGNSILPPSWLEIAVAVDYTLVTFHGKDKLEQYVLALMNIVSAIYQDASLEGNVKLAITRMIFYENKKQSVVRPGHAKKSLENVNSWNNRLHASLAPDETRHDVAIWLTRSDIGGPSGYAPVSGTCDPKRSCALNRDEGLTSAFIIAHELAHILGLSHDGDRKSGNTCANEAKEGSVMAPMVGSTFHKFSWSRCSRREFRRKIKKWPCLANPPSGLDEIVLNSTLQNAFSMDEQCRMEFGEGYTLCRAFDIIEPCSHLWCGHIRSPLVCKTKKGPPLEGTECGYDMWCVNGYCEDIGQRHFGRSPVMLNPQDGGWSEWSSWGSCSRSCGTGVEFRSRKCNNPLPMYGGKNCHGESEEWRVCARSTCPEPLKDLRAQQCRRLPKLLNIKENVEVNFTWLPYESEQIDLKCKLICISEQSKELYITSENLIDGSLCSYENTDNICVQGVCQQMGCDGELHSKIKRDKCGTCGGNNTDCTMVQSQYQRKLRREVSRAVVLPRMAREIKLETNVTMQKIDDPAIAFILKNRKKKKYSMTIPNAGTYTEIMEGTKFFYKKYKNHHKIWAKGPILAEMVILFYVPISEIDVGVNISLKSNYFISRGALIPSKRFTWILGGWGPCSASCGGGRRQRTVACFDNQNNQIVKRKHCSLLVKPTLEYEKCNTFSCNFQWIAGEWEPCSATCGLNGIQHREVYCFPQQVFNTMLFKHNGTIMDNPWKYMVNPNRCSGLLPATTRPCNREPCPSFWSWSEWSQCSTSCGMGVVTRSSFCPPPENESYFTCGEAPSYYQTKACRGRYTRHTNVLCRRRKRKPCMGDQSKYCFLNYLAKYCRIGGFRRLCCKSCMEYRLTPVSV